jgi:class 3 adenylate cyclase
VVTAANPAEQRSLPSGVLTFLMTDVVGSTTLWESAPGLMDAALTRHDQLIDAAVQQFGGFVLKHRGEGDSTFCVFASAADAAAAAIEAQRQLASETWDDATPMSVRMGLHTGEAILRGYDYYGQTVNRAARVRAAARGGQVLMSGACAALVEASLPPDTDLNFLRHEKLRGIEQPEAIHELVDRQREPLPATAPAVGPWELPPALAVPRWFSGRDDAIAELASLVATARSGQPMIALLSGEPGAGKSSLAAATAQRAHEQGWVVVSGRSDPEIASPYLLFREALAQYVASAPAEVLAEHVGEHGGEVARLVPELSARVGAVAAVEALDPETSRQLLVEAVADLVARAARRQPLMIVLDDLHWADRNALLLLRRLAKIAPPVPLVIVGTYRSDAADRWELRDLLIDLRSLAHVREIAVEGLSEGDLLEFLQRRAGASLGPDGAALARYLREQTGGNAYFTTELLRHLVETGVIASDERHRWSITVELHSVQVPRTIRSVLQERVGRLPGDAQRVLGAASVGGREFETKLIAAVMECSELEVLDAVEAAARSSLVRELTVGRFEFAHALVRQNVEEALGATRRGLYHERWARAIEAELGDRSPADVLAGHWAATGRDERARISHWSRKAGAAAMAALSPEDAVRWFRRALDAALDDRQRLAVMIDLGDAQRWSGGDAFRRTLLDAAGLADRLGDHHALVRAALANNRGGTSASGVTDAERVAVLERALDVAGDRDSPERACLLATLAIELSQSDAMERRAALADEAVACAHRLGDEVTLLKVLLLTTESNRLPATLETRLVDTDRLFSIATRLGDPVLLATAAVRQARMKIEAAQFDQLDAVMSVLDEVAHLNPYARWNRLILLACRAQVHGDLAGASQLAAEALAAAEADGQPDARSVYVAQIAGIRWDAGTLGALLPMIEQTLRDNPRLIGFRGFLGLACCEADRGADASAILAHETATQFSAHPLTPLWLITVSLFASLCIELDDADAAPILYDLLRPWRGRANSTVVSINGLVTESLAGLALAAGRLDQAATDCAEALEQARRCGATVSEVRSRLALARLAMRRDAAGDFDLAARELAAVRHDAARLGLGTVLRHAERLTTEAERRRQAGTR